MGSGPGPNRCHPCSPLSPVRRQATGIFRRNRRFPWIAGCRTPGPVAHIFHGKILGPTDNCKFCFFNLHILNIITLEIPAPPPGGGPEFRFLCKSPQQTAQCISADSLLHFLLKKALLDIAFSKQKGYNKVCILISRFKEQPGPVAGNRTLFRCHSAEPCSPTEGGETNCR